MIKCLIAFLFVGSTAWAGIGIGITPYPGPGAVTSDSGSGVVTVDHLWDFENNAEDSVGSVDLTVSGVTYSTSSPKSGSYIGSFSGSSSYAEAVVDSFTTFSCGGWINFVSISAARIICSKHGTSGNYGFAAKNNNGALEFGISSNGTNYTSGITAGGIVFAGTWYHIVFVYDGTYKRIYINGSEVNSGDFPQSYSSGVNISSKPLMLGAQKPTTIIEQVFSGYMDEVFFKKSSLSSAEIQSIYVSGL